MATSPPDPWMWDQDTQEKLFPQGLTSRFLLYHVNIDSKEFLQDSEETPNFTANEEDHADYKTKSSKLRLPPEFKRQTIEFGLIQTELEDTQVPRHLRPIQQGLELPLFLPKASNITMSLRCIGFVELNAEEMILIRKFHLLMLRFLITHQINLNHLSIAQFGEYLTWTTLMVPLNTSVNQLDQEKLGLGAMISAKHFLEWQSMTCWWDRSTLPHMNRDTAKAGQIICTTYSNPFYIYLGNEEGVGLDYGITPPPAKDAVSLRDFFRIRWNMTTLKEETFLVAAQQLTFRTTLWANHVITAGPGLLHAYSDFKYGPSPNVAHLINSEKMPFIEKIGNYNKKKKNKEIPDHDMTYIYIILDLVLIDASQDQRDALTHIIDCNKPWAAQLEVVLPEKIKTIWHLDVSKEAISHALASNDGYIDINNKYSNNSKFGPTPNNPSNSGSSKDIQYERLLKAPDPRVQTLIDALEAEFVDRDETTEREELLILSSSTPVAIKATTPTNVMVPKETSPSLPHSPSEDVARRIPESSTVYKAEFNTQCLEQKDAQANKLDCDFMSRSPSFSNPQGGYSSPSYKHSRGPFDPSKHFIDVVENENDFFPGAVSASSSDTPSTLALKHLSKKHSSPQPNETIQSLTSTSELPHATVDEVGAYLANIQISPIRPASSSPHVQTSTTLQQSTPEILPSPHSLTQSQGKSSSRIPFNPNLRQSMGSSLTSSSRSSLSSRSQMSSPERFVDGVEPPSLPRSFDQSIPLELSTSSLSSSTQSVSISKYPAEKASNDLVLQNDAPNGENKSSNRSCSPSFSNARALAKPNQSTQLSTPVASLSIPIPDSKTAPMRETPMDAPVSIHPTASPPLSNEQPTNTPSATQYNSTISTKYKADGSTTVEIETARKTTHRLLPQTVLMTPYTILDMTLLCHIPSLLLIVDRRLASIKFREKVMPQFPIPADRIEEALTCSSANHINYQRLETLGDAYLKYCVSKRLFFQNASWNEGKLTYEKLRFIRNKFLATSEIAPTFASHCITNPLNVLNSYLHPAPKNSVSEKTKADLIEAIIGAAYLELGDSNGETGKFLDWLLPPIGQLSHDDVLPHSYSLRSSFPGLEEIETLFQHKFNDKSLPLMALTHSSCSSRFIPEDYERLEFLGDAVLDIVVTELLFKTDGSLNPGEISALRSSIVCNAHLAVLTLQYNLHKFLRYDSYTIYEDLLRYTENLRQFSAMTKCNQLGMLPTLPYFDMIYSPEVLGDLFESLAGAIYVDLGCNLDAFKKIFVPIFQIHVDKFLMNGTSSHPISKVTRLLADIGCVALQTKEHMNVTQLVWHNREVAEITNKSRKAASNTTLYQFAYESIVQILQEEPNICDCNTIRAVKRKKKEA